MLDNIPSIAAFATQMSTQKIAQQVDIAVLNKAQELQEQQGQAILQLMETAVPPVDSLDVYV